MDLPSSHQVPSGPMNRSRARAHEVTSLLLQFHFDEHEAWLLPHMDTLCILRHHGEAKEQDKKKRKMDEKTEKKEG